MNVRPESVGLSTERLARIRPAVEQSIGPDKIAGAVTLVARHGKVAHYEATGLMDRGAPGREAMPMRPDALFCIYSMTKPIVCTALMTLYERGAFQLLAPSTQVGSQFPQQTSSLFLLCSPDQFIPLRLTPHSSLLTR